LVVHQRGGAASAGLELGHTPRKLLAAQLCSLKWSNFHATAISRSVWICVDQEILINRWWWPGWKRNGSQCQPEQFGYLNMANRPVPSFENE